MLYAVLRQTNPAISIVGTPIFSSVIAKVVLESKINNLNKTLNENNLNNVKTFNMVRSNQEETKDIKCEYCGSVYSINLEGCPNCGGPRKK